MAPQSLSPALPSFWLTPQLIIIMCLTPSLPRQDSWEPEANILDRHLITAFERSYSRRKESGGGSARKAPVQQTGRHGTLHASMVSTATPGVTSTAASSTDASISSVSATSAHPLLPPPRPCLWWAQAQSYPKQALHSLSHPQIRVGLGYQVDMPEWKAPIRVRATEPSRAPLAR